MNEVRLPATWVAGGYGVPGVCTAHGEAAVVNRRIGIVSRPPAWTYLLLLAAVIVFAIVAAVLRKSITAPTWPFCARCRRTRTLRLVGGFGLLALCVVAFVLAFAMAATHTTADSSDFRTTVTAVGLLVAFLAFLAGVILAGRGAYPAIARTRLTGDGQWVRVPRAHPEFARRVAAAVPAPAPPPPPYW